MVFSFELPEESLAAANLSLTIDEDAVGIGQLQSSGGGSASPSYQILTNPGKGTVSISGNTLTYYPRVHLNGSDTFTYQVTKGTQTATGHGIDSDQRGG